MINYEKLNKFQYEAVMHDKGPALLLAGAGTGKTRTLIYRVAHLIESGVSPESILLLTFTNKAANEMKERAEKMLKEKCGITACTYHSFCVKMLRFYGKMAGISPDFTIISGPDEADIIDIVKSELNFQKLKNMPSASVFASMLSTCVNKRLTLEELLKEQKYWRFRQNERKLLLLREETKKYKEEHNLFNYDDILLKFDQMLTDYSNIARRIEDTYRYIMVDEYQDTNTLQDSIIRKIRTKNTNLMVVGDDMQSIYKFRGADVQNILSFPKRYTNCKVIYLTENYRSSQEILNLANHVMTNATEGYQKNLRAQFSSQELPKVYGVNDTKTEAEFVLNRIKAKHAEGIPYNDICVLYRNSFQSYELEVLLNKAGLDFEKYGGIRFLDRAHIKDILAFLKIYSNPHDQLSWFRILQLHIGVGKVYAKNISEKCLENGPEYLINECHSRRKYRVYLKKLYEEIMSWEGKDFLQILNSCCAYYTAVREETIQNQKVDSESTREESLQDLKKDKEDIEILVNMAKDYDSVLDFLDAMTLDAAKSKENAEDKLILSTIHSVKGLEFDTIILLDCVDDILPSTMYIGSPEDNEDVRCMYVAVTRAKNTLYMIVPKIVLKYGKAIPGYLSRYIEDKEDLYDFCNVEENILGS
ncbi:ATP-dependent helicase [Anaerobutyricum hallii]|uniref:ATP-dependent helicase n=2 Tax=Anaerobutyricum hallii TaxID=39488 RepID=UPI00399105A2